MEAKKINVDPGIEHCNLCHIFGYDELVEVQVVGAGQSDQPVLICPDCAANIAAAYGSPEETVTPLEVARADKKAAVSHDNQDTTMEEMLLSAVQDIRKGRVVPDQGILLMVNKGTEDHPQYLTNFFLNNAKCSEAISMLEVGKVLMLEQMGYVLTNGD